MLPKFVAVCIYEEPNNKQKAKTCIVDPKRDMTIKAFLYPHLPNKTAHISIHQLLSNGALSPALNETILLTELIDFYGLITTLVVLTLDVESKQAEVQQSPEPIVSQPESQQLSRAPSPTSYVSSKRSVLGPQKMQLVEQSWVQSYVPARIYAVPTESRVISQFQEKFQEKLDFEIKVMASSRVSLLHKCDIASLCDHAQQLEVNLIDEQPYEKQDAQILIVRDCYGGWAFVIVKKATEEVELCLPLTCRFYTQLLVLRAQQQIAACQPSRAVKCVAGFDSQTVNDLNIQCMQNKLACEDEIKQGQIITFLLNLDGLCFAFEIAAGDAIAIQQQLQMAYGEMFGENQEQKQEFSSILGRRMASINLAEGLNKAFIFNYQQIIRDLQVKYMVLDPIIFKMMQELETQGSISLVSTYKRDTIFAAFREVALRSDIVRTQLITSITVSFTTEQLTEYQKLFMLDLFEQMFLYPFESDQLRNFNIEIFRDQVMSQRMEQLQQSLVDLSKFEYKQIKVPFPSLTQMFPSVEPEAVQFGVLNCCLLVIHPQTDTVQTLQKEYIIPSTQLQITPTILGKDFKRFLQLLPQLLSNGIQQIVNKEQPALKGIYKDVAVAFFILAKQQQLSIQNICDNIFLFNFESSQIMKSTTACIFGIIISQERQNTPIENFLQQFSLLYSGKDLTLQPLRRYLNCQVAQLQLNNSTTSQKIQDGNHFYLFVANQNKVLVDQMTGLPPHYYCAQQTDIEATMQYFSTYSTHLQVGLRIQFDKRIRFIQMLCVPEDIDIYSLDGTIRLEYKDVEDVSLAFITQYQPAVLAQLAEAFRQSLLLDDDDLYLEEEDGRREQPKDDFALRSLLQQSFIRLPDQFKQKQAFEAMLTNSVMRQMYIYSVCEQFQRIDFDQNQIAQLTPEYLQNIWADQSQMYNNNMQYINCAVEFQSLQLSRHAYLGRAEEEQQILGIKEFYDVPEQCAPFAMAPFITRISFAGADEIAQAQLQNGHLIETLQAQQQVRTETDLNECEQRLLEILDDFSAHAGESDIIVKARNTYERLHYLYKYVMRFVFALEIPTNEAQAREWEKVMKKSHPIIKHVETKHVQHQDQFSECIYESTSRFARLIGALSEVGDGIEAAQCIVFEFPQAVESEKKVEKKETKVENLDINKMLNDFLKMCDE